MKFFFPMLNASIISLLLYYITSESNKDFDRRFTDVINKEDDESMFLTPFLEYLAQKRGTLPELRINMLTLSIGNAEGKGEKRRIELQVLCAHYGIYCGIIDDPLLQDGTEEWDQAAALGHIRTFVDHVKCTFLVTFDDRGVSGHANHISTHHAVVALKEERPSLIVWELETLGTFMKYAPFVSSLAGLFKTTFFNVRFLRVLENMKKHASQMKPHVYLWSIFSAYCYTNTFREM